MVMQDVLEEAETLTLEDREILVELLRHRLADDKRKAIVENDRQALEDYRNGNVSKGSAEDLFRAMRD